MLPEGEMNLMKRNFWKMGLAATFTLTGIGVASPQKMVDAATLKTPIKRVQVNSLHNKGINVWTNYEGGQLIKFRAKNKSKWNVAATAVDRKGRLWYKIGASEWIEARYTIDLKERSEKSKVSAHGKPANTVLPKKKNKKRKITNLKVSKKRQIVSAPSKKAGQKKANHTKLNYLSNTKPATGNLNQKAQAIVNLAKSQVGKGYAWGGNGPDNFDCSGLVQYVYNRAAGIKLPRVTTDQVKVGATVAMDQLQPGDLLYWGSVDAPYHVGIYIGNNQFVCAATPEQGVVIQTISSYFYPCVAKRVI